MKICVKCETSHGDWYGLTCGYCGNETTETERDSYYASKLAELLASKAGN